MKRLIIFILSVFFLNLAFGQIDLERQTRKGPGPNLVLKTRAADSLWRAVPIDSLGIISAQGSDSSWIQTDTLFILSSDGDTTIYIPGAVLDTDLSLNSLGWNDASDTLTAYIKNKGGSLVDSVKVLISGFAAASHVHDAGDITTGTFADALVAQSNVTQHQGAIDHGSIGGLTDDDHTQYALLAGRSGGQTLIGGTAASNNLTLRSTSHATKGNVKIEGLNFVDKNDPTRGITFIWNVATATTRTWNIPDKNLNFGTTGDFAYQAVRTIGAGNGIRVNNGASAFLNADPIIKVDWSGSNLTQTTTWDTLDRIATWDNSANNMRYVNWSSWKAEMYNDLNHNLFSGYVANQHIDWTLASQGTIHASNYVDNDTQLSEEQVSDYVLSHFTGNTTSLITVTPQDVDNTIDFEVEPNLSNFTNDAGFLTSEVDGSVTNEIQVFDSLNYINLTTGIDTFIFKLSLDDSIYHVVMRDSFLDNTADWLGTLDGYEAAALLDNVTTDLSIGTHNASQLDVLSSDGTDITLPLATSAGGTNLAGLMSPTQFDNIVANNAKVTNATHTGQVTGSTTLTLDVTAISDQTLVTAASGDHVLIRDDTDGQLKKVNALDFLSGGGEVNTMSNEGVAGVGVFKQKTGVNFEMKNINAGSSKVTVADDAGNNEVDVDVVENQIDHNALLNFEGNAHIDHSGVTLTAGTGLSGGGDITANRTFNVDFSEFTVVDTVTTNNFYALYDTAATAHQRISKADWLRMPNRWTGQQYFPIQTLTDQATITWDGNTQQVAKVTLTANRTLANMTNVQPGAVYTLYFIQSTGGHTITFGSNYLFSGGDPTLSTGAGDIDKMVCGAISATQLSCDCAFNYE